MARRDEIKGIERSMIELSQLVIQTNELVTQQAPAVENIDQGAERVAGDLGNANVQLGQAVQSARNARKWKWYALIIISKYYRSEIHRHKTNNGHLQLSSLPSSWLLPLVSRRRKRNRCDVSDWHLVWVYL